MAIALTNGSDGGLFDRIGNLGGGIDAVHTLLAAWDTRAADLDADYAASPANQSVLDGLFQSVSGYQQGQNGFLSGLRTIAANTLIEMANADSPLASKSVKAAMAVLIQQMVAASQSVNASAITIGSQTSVGSPTGTPTIVVSARHVDGRTREYLVPELIRFACTSDAGVGGVARRETFQVTTPAQISESLSYNWPGGSGVNKTLTSVDSSLDGSVNLLTNSDFESFTADVPAGWAVLAGAAGTDIFASGGSDAFASSTNALKFTGTASDPLSAIAQTFGSGTTATLKPNTVYLVNAYCKRSASLTGAGTLSLDLIDGSGTVINDDQGTANAITKVLSTLTTSYASLSGAFVTPRALPSTVKFRVRLSTAIADDGESVYLDNLALTAGAELYPGGPFAGVFAGAALPLTGDAYTVQISNTWGGFQKLFQRLFDMRGLGLQLPSNGAGSETIADSLIA